MNCNDVLRSIRYTLSLSDQKISEIITQAGVPVDKATVSTWMLAEDEAGYFTPERTLRYLAVASPSILPHSVRRAVTLGFTGTPMMLWVA